MSHPFWELGTAYGEFDSFKHTYGNEITRGSDKFKMLQTLAENMRDSLAKAREYLEELPEGQQQDAKDIISIVAKAIEEHDKMIKELSGMSDLETRLHNIRMHMHSISLVAKGNFPSIVDDDDGHLLSNKEIQEMIVKKIQEEVTAIDRDCLMIYQAGDNFDSINAFLGNVRVIFGMDDYKGPENDERPALDIYNELSDLVAKMSMILKTEPTDEMNNEFILKEAKDLIYAATVVRIRRNIAALLYQPKFVTIPIDSQLIVLHDIRKIEEVLEP